jgi:hypothetical protein
MIKLSQRAGETLIMIALDFCLFSTVTPRLDAQWYWSSGIIENGGVTVFPSWGITASGKTVMFQSGKKPLVKSRPPRFIGAIKKANSPLIQQQSVAHEHPTPTDLTSR